MRKAVAGWWRLIGGLVLALFVGSAPAAPAHCSYGYQDSSCLGPQYRAAQTAPTCQTAPGWTTVSAAVWIGSRFTQPQCNYQAQPTCPDGYDQASAPIWNGASWEGLSCALPPAPHQTPEDEANACVAKARTASLWPVSGTPRAYGPYQSVGWSAYLDPDQWANGNYVARQSPMLFAGIGSFDPPQVANDMFMVQGGADLFHMSINFCFVQPRTTDIIGFYNFADAGLANPEAALPTPPPNTGFTLMPPNRRYNPSGSYEGLYYQGPGGTLLAP